MQKRWKTNKKQNRRFGKTANRTHKFNVAQPRKEVMRGGTRL